MREPAQSAAAAATERSEGRSASGERAVAGESRAAAVAPSPVLTASVPPSFSASPASASILAPAPPVSAAAVEPAPPPTARLRYLEALAAASSAISATLELDKVVQVLAARTAALLEVPGVSVLLLEERQQQQEIRVAASVGLSPEYAASHKAPLEKSIAARALAENRTFAAWDVRQVPDPRAAEAAQREGITSVACAPMFFAGRPVGSLNLYCRDPHCFSEDQFHVLSLLAAQGAVAISNARAYRELRARSAEVRASFQRVGAALAASLDVGETLRLIVDLTVDMTRAEAGALFMLGDERAGGGLLLSSARGLDRRSVRRFRHSAPSALALRALEERRAITVPDTRRQTDTAFPTLRMANDQAVETRSVICVPVLVGDRPVGVLEQYASEPGRFDKNDIQILTSFALHAAVAIENARLYAQERSVSQTLQRAFLPDLPGSISGFQIGRIYAPGSEVAGVGGDTYDLFTLPDGRIAALIADVCGQGAVAATITVMAKYTVRAYALENPDPPAVLARVNEALIHQTGDSTFLTLCYALIDPVTRSITVASAAHPPALLCRPSEGTCRAVGGEPGLIAGFLPGQAYPSQTLTVRPGDVLVFYTDGVIEARKRKMMFDMERLKRVIEQQVDRTAQEIAAAIYAAVADYAASDLSDDIALLVLKAD